MIPLVNAGPAQSGLTLIELMISIALGLAVMVAMGYLYLGSREAYRTQDSVARLQENGRYALEVMGRDLRMAGFIGCGSLSDPGLKLQVLASQAPPFNLGTVLRGFDSGWGVDTDLDGDVDAADRPAHLVANTDSIVVYQAANDEAFLSANMTAAAADVPIAKNAHEYKQADIVVISDCTNVDIFRASEDGKASVKHAVGGCTDATTKTTFNPCNSNAALGKAYGSTAMVMPLEANIYFLRTNPAGNPSLYRMPWGGGTWGASEEVVENVEAMQITYGVDDGANGGTANDRAVDRYVTANNVANWAQVLAVRVSLLLRSPENNVASQAQSYVWDTNNDGDMLDAGDTVNPNDRRLRYVFTSTIALRNRVQ